MAVQYICSVCRRALGSRLLHPRPSNAILQEPRLVSKSSYNRRCIFTTRPYQASQAVESDATKVASSPSTASEEPTTSRLSHQRPTQFSPVRSIAKELRKRATATTETYVAYGACENLVKECARQASYNIPQAQKKNVDIPKTKDGEDLGVGAGWWYDRM